VKKTIFILIGALIFTFVNIDGASANAIKVYINGEQKFFPQAPFTENGRTLVPLRGIFEGLGAEVKWDNATQSITATKEKTNIYLKLGSKQAKVDGKSVTIDVPAKAINGSTMVPIRFVSESLGAEVKWDASASAVRIESSTKTLKFYSNVSHHYETLETFGEIVVDHRIILGLAYDEFSLFGTRNTLNTAMDRYDDIVGAYNNLLTPTNTMIQNGRIYNQDLSDMNSILNDYKTSLEHYADSIYYLERYYYSNSSNDFNNYLDSRGYGFDYALEGSSKANDGYMEFYNKLQSYR
jgi:Copper amine oxidase N-terminal domain